MSLQVLVSIPPSYPETSPPQLQLLSRYIGPFGVDADLFGSIIKTFMSVNGVEWIPGVVCLFDGLQSILERVFHWYERRLESKREGEALREQSHASQIVSEKPEASSSTSASTPLNTQSVTLPEGIKLYEAAPIVDRKSAFIGRACRICDPAQVGEGCGSYLINRIIKARKIPLILAFLMADRRIAKAAHPIINAWRCHVGNVLYQGMRWSVVFARTI